MPNTLQRCPFIQLSSLRPGLRIEFSQHTVQSWCRNVLKILRDFLFYEIGSKHPNRMICRFFVFAESLSASNLSKSSDERFAKRVFSAVSDESPLSRLIFLANGVCDSCFDHCAHELKFDNWLPARATLLKENGFLKRSWVPVGFPLALNLVTETGVHHYTAQKKWCTSLLYCSKKYWMSQSEHCYL